VILGAGKRESGKQKAWMNTLLETNPVPTIWIANEVAHIDPAFLRRFTYTMALKTPPRSVRERILGQYLQDQPVTPGWIRATAHIEHMPPALVENAARVLSLYGPKNSDEAEEVLERTLRSSLQLMGFQYNRPAYTCATQYDPRFINASIDAISLSEALKRHPSAKMCFYGPPGTGKTAFAHYLAEQADRPVLVKSASDLLDKYVGETEARIARMFEQASDEQAVLILDEADSFLRDRRDAVNSWEVTQVNELLVQMERFKGTFICTTNLMERLDAASLRRFSFKVHFDYLQLQQRIDLFLQEFHEVLPKKRLERAAIASELEKLQNLTPGDIAVVKRQVEFFETAPTLAELLDSLALECRSKPGQQSGRMGFLR
jgi:transitional endoplasmic reticulum ATPase